MRHEGNMAALEAELLREVAEFMRSAAKTIEALIPTAQALHTRLVGTATFQRVDGLDNGDDEPIWDVAGTLDILFKDDAERVAAYLQDAASRVRQALRDAR